MPPGLNLEQYKALKALSDDMLAASSQLFSLHFAG